MTEKRPRSTSVILSAAKNLFPQMVVKAVLQISLFWERLELFVVTDAGVSKAPLTNARTAQVKA